MRSRPPLRLHHVAAAAALGLVLHFAAATAPGDDHDDPAAGSGRTPWLSPGLRLQGPASFGERWGTGDLRAGEVRWERHDERSQWFARVSMGPLPLGDSNREGAVADSGAVAVLPAPTLQAEAQWLYRGWAGHALRLGAQARQELAPTTLPAGAIGASVQDDWSIAPSWRLALGARGGATPELASTLTPRAALSWQALPALQVKLVDGVTWRDADGAETPAAVRLKATELAVDWQALPALRLAGSLHRQREAAALTAVALPPALPAALDFAQVAAAGALAAGDGVGLEGAFAGDDGWGVRARWSAFQARADDAEATGAARLFAALRTQAPLPWRGASASLEWLRIDQRPAALGAVALSQTLLNASVAWAPSGSPWTLAANAYNLADHALSDDATDALVREGRRWQVQVTRPF